MSILRLVISIRDDDESTTEFSSAEDFQGISKRNDTDTGPSHHPRVAASPAKLLLPCDSAPLHLRNSPEYQ